MAAEDPNIPVYILGQRSIGRTSLAYRLSTGEFLTERVSVAHLQGYSRATVDVDDRTWTVHLHDPVRLPEGEPWWLPDNWHRIRKAEGLILAFSVTNRASFEVLDQLYQGALETRKVGGVIAQTVPVVMAALCVDADAESRVVDHEEAAGKAKAWGFPYFETSSKTGQDIQELLEGFVREALGARARRERLGLQEAESSLTSYAGLGLKRKKAKRCPEKSQKATPSSAMQGNCSIQ